jgi:hypothetical protein
VTVVLKRAKRPKPRNSTQIQKTSTVKNGHEIDPPSCSNISRRDCAMLSDSCTARLCIIRSASVLGERLRSCSMLAFTEFCVARESRFSGRMPSRDQIRSCVCTIASRSPSHASFAPGP